VLSWIGNISIIAIIVVTTTDVIGRSFLNKPLLGNIELTELSMATLGGVAILLTTSKHGHIVVDILLVRFPKHVQAIIYRIGAFLGFVALATLASLIFLEGVMDKLKFDKYTEILHLPSAPFESILAVGLFLCSLRMLLHAFLPQTESKKAEKKMEDNLDI
jgi:TRAP-type C4-dicarboxylate transport system permease small subunit